MPTFNVLALWYDPTEIGFSQLSAAICELENSDLLSLLMQGFNHSLFE
jgi:hypothetical protein